MPYKKYGVSDCRLLSEVVTETKPDRLGRRRQVHCAICGMMIWKEEGSLVRIPTKYDSVYIKRVVCDICRPKIIARYCECGCGEVVNPGHRYMKGHYWRIYNKLPEVREAKIGNGNVMKNPTVRKRHLIAMNSPELKAVWSEQAKQDNPMRHQSAKDKHRLLKKGKPLSLSHIKATSRGIIQWHKDNPWVAQNHKQRWHNDKEWRERTIRSILEASHQRPNRLEHRFIDFCSENKLPYRYVGGGEVIIGGMNPDFININGAKQVIEIYGEYWHHDDGSLRIQKFAEAGYECLIIWESEFKDTEKMLQKVKGFCYVENLD